MTQIHEQMIKEFPQITLCCREREKNNIYGMSYQYYLWVNSHKIFFKVKLNTVTLNKQITNSFGIFTLHARALLNFHGNQREEIREKAIVVYLSSAEIDG